MSMFSEKNIHLLAKVLFRAGFASIFLANAVVAVVTPEAFKGLITTNIIGQYFPASLIDAMVWFIALNDVFIGVAILSGKWRYFIYIWAGLWLIIIAGIKATNLIF